MKNALPIFVIFLVVLFFFRQTLLHNLLPIPADALVGLYHPFRDLFSQLYPRGIPFHNFLITDPIRQQFPWRFLAIDQFKNFQFPLWNPYDFSGYPLLGNMQSAVFYPLNIFFFIFPFSFAWILLIFLSPLLAGYFMYFYLQNVYLSKFAALFGGITFAFCGFFAAWLEWGTILHVALWLPLILLCIDKLVSKEQKFQFPISNFKFQILLLFSLSSSFFAGHLQTFFYVIVLSFFYATFRLFQVKKTKPLISFAVILFLFFIIIIVQFLPFLQFYSLSARTIDQANWHAAGWFIPWQHLAQFIAPDFFGNPVTLNYFGVWNYGELVGYFGILPLIMVFYALLYKRTSLTKFMFIAVLISFLFALPTGVSSIPFIIHLPLLSTSQPTRLLFLIDFCLSVIAAIGFDYFLKLKNKQIMPMIIVAFFFILLWIVVFFGSHLNLFTSENAVIAKRNLYFPSALFIVSSLILLYFLFTKEIKSRTVLVFFFLAIVVFDLLRFADKFNSFTPTSYLFPQTKTISYLQANAGMDRIMTLDSRILAPNVTSYYKLQSIEGYDPLYLQRYGELIAANERNSANISGPFGFNRIITPHNYHSQIINLLGVKYILSLTQIKDPNLIKVFQEGETIVYQNKNAFPRAFFVRSITNVNSKHDAISTVFKTNLKENAIVENGSNQTFTSIGNVAITSYTPNTITLTTKNDGNGFLVLTDIFYPTWEATIDGKTTQIFQTDYTFRGIIVSAGEHKIIFTDTIL